MAVLTSLRKRFRWFLGIALIPIALCAEPRAGGLSEQELKAAALNQVVHFVRWPASVFPEVDTPLIIGIYGEDPFGDLLDDLVHGENVNGHPVRIVRCFTPDAALTCQAVYVSSSNKRNADLIIHLLGERNILTVTDDETLADEGAVIAFTVRSHRIHIAANLEAARRASLTLSSKLLRLAEIMKK